MTTTAPASSSERHVDLAGLDQLLGFHLRMAMLAVYRDFSEAVADLDLTQRQVATLELIHANPGVSQVDLASVLWTDRATIMAVVDRLEKRELLFRERSKEDRRRQELHLTERGRTLLTEVKQRISAHEQKFVSAFEPRELKDLVAGLKRIQQIR